MSEMRWEEELPEIYYKCSVSFLKRNTVHTCRECYDRITPNINKISRLPVIRQKLQQLDVDAELYSHDVY